VRAQAHAGSNPASSARVNSLDILIKIAQTEIMRISARAFAFARFFFAFLISAGVGFALFMGMTTPASAQTSVSPTPYTQTTTSSDYRKPLTDANVPQNSHTYAQVVVIDLLSALMCNLAGIDPMNPQQPCLGINPVTNQIGYVQDPAPQFGEQQTTPQVGGALGFMTQMVSTMYTPTISSTQYSQYLASNFGIVKTANAQAPPATPAQDCSKSPIGYGFCGLNPIFSLWVASRDFAYAILVLAFVFLGLGVMLRFKVDPRTAMTLQNQIPRVIIAILLITFSYAIAGIMIDLMWTVTYAGVNAIASSSNAQVRAGCTDQPGDPAANPANPAPAPGAGQSLGQTATNNLLDNPVSFANRIYLRDCEGINSGIVNISDRVSEAFVSLIHSIINEFMGWDDGEECSIIPWNFEECLEDFGLWITGLIVTLIIIIAIFIALFRLWFELIKAYITFFVFVILGPIWIVFGLIPGRPMGFERWMRLIFANLAAFPLVAFMLVFARVLVEAIPANPDPTGTFIPPLVGNPNATAFNVLMAFGAIILAPTIPAMIREKMKAGQGKMGHTIAAGAAVATGVATAPATKTWAHLNRFNSKTGNPQGLVAIAKTRFTNKVLGKSRLGQSWRRNKFGGGYEPAEAAQEREERRRSGGGGGGTGGGG
jgi:hypothetical protein